MSGVIFQPWVGDKYWSDNHFGLRVLVLGESHYGNGTEERANFTRQVVLEWGKQKRHRFFTTIANVLLNRDGGWISDEDRSGIWDHVAFYNYVQEVVGEGPRIRPTEKMWNNAREPFLHVVTDLRPEVVLILGAELAQYVPELPADVMRCEILHPSYTYFSYEGANPQFSGAIQRAMARKAERETNYAQAPA